MTSISGIIKLGMKIVALFGLAALTGTARAHASGIVEGQSINCVATYDVTGSRR